MQKKSLKWILLWVIFLFVLSPLSVVLCVRLLSSQKYYIAAVIIIALAMVPFAAYFENKKIKTAEIAVLAVMIAICVASRTVFSFLPQVKPMCAFVIVSAIAFGPNVGFVTGAVSVFVSNFIFGQGMFTPFQMLGMGFVGFFSALIFYGKGRASNRLAVSIVGAVLCFFVYGSIVDTCSVLMMLSEYTPHAILGVYLAGIPYNLIHAATTAVFLFFITKPMNDKFSRLRTKYGCYDNAI